MKTMLFAAALIAASALGPMAYAAEYDTDGNPIVDDDTTGSVIIKKEEPTVVIQKEQPTVIIKKQSPTVVIHTDDNGDIDDAE